nr:hypothetical protein [Candidatus Dormibacteraeota bacterium]
MNAGLITTKAVALAAAGAVSTVGFSLAANAAAPTPAITPTVVSYAPVDMGTLASHPLTSIY